MYSFFEVKSGIPVFLHIFEFVLVSFFGEGRKLFNVHEWTSFTNAVQSDLFSHSLPHSSKVETSEVGIPKDSMGMFS